VAEAPAPAEAPAATQSSQQVAINNLGHLATVFRLAHSTLVKEQAAGNLEPEPYHVLIISPDGAPEHYTLETPDQVCETLAEVRDRVQTLANMAAEDDDESDVVDDDNAAPQLMFWIYVFRGRRLGVDTGRLWQLRDGDRIYDVTPAETANFGDGCVVVPTVIDDDAPADEEPAEVPDAAQ
jgi:hypothetical protein